MLSRFRLSRIQFQLTLIASAALLGTIGGLSAQAEAPVRVVIIDLVHGHAQGLLSSLPNNSNVELVGIAEPDIQARGALRAAIPP